MQNLKIFGLKNFSKSQGRKCHLHSGKKRRGMRLERVDAGNMSCYLQHHVSAEGLLCLVGDEFVSPLFSTLIRPQKHIVEVAETEV